MWLSQVDKLNQQANDFRSKPLPLDSFHHCASFAPIADGKKLNADDLGAESNQTNNQNNSGRRSSVIAMIPGIAPIDGEFHPLSPVTCTFWRQTNGSGEKRWVKSNTKRVFGVFLEMGVCFEFNLSTRLSRHKYGILYNTVLCIVQPWLGWKLYYMLVHVLYSYIDLSCAVQVHKPKHIPPIKM